MSSILDYIGIGLPAMQGFAVEDARFRQRSGGAPLSPFNQALLERAQADLPDYMGELEAAQAQYPDPRTGWSENFANAIAGMRMQPPGNFGEGLLAGLAQGFSGATRGRYAEKQEKQERLRGAASELAKRRWERAAEAKEKAQAGLQASAMEEQRQGGRESLADQRNAAMWDRMNASLARRDEIAEAREQRAASRDALLRQRFDVNNLMGVNRAVANDLDIKKFREVRSAYADGITAAAANNSSGDIVLMRMLAKATDPTTGVREEEYRTFEGAQGALSRLVTIPNKWTGQGQLTPEGRREMLKRLKERYDNSKRASDSRMQHFRAVAGAVGVPWELVDQDFGLGEQEPKPDPLDADLGGSGY